MCLYICIFVHDIWIQFYRNHIIIINNSSHRSQNPTLRLALWALPINKHNNNNKHSVSLNNGCILYVYIYPQVYIYIRIPEISCAVVAAHILLPLWMLNITPFTSCLANQIWETTKSDNTYIYIHILLLSLYICFLGDSYIDTTCSYICIYELNNIFAWNGSAMHWTKYPSDLWTMMAWIQFTRQKVRQNVDDQATAASPSSNNENDEMDREWLYLCHVRKWI